MTTEAQPLTDALTQTGDSPAFPVPPASAPMITPMMMDLLRQARPWVRFLSIVGFITAGLMILSGIFIQFGGILAWTSSSSRFRPPFTASNIFLVGLAYISLAVLYFFPALYLSLFADAIKRLLTQDRDCGMEEVLRHQRRFWRSAGIACLGTISVYALLLIGGFHAAAFRGLLRQ